jgi:hypothetical protein
MGCEPHKFGDDMTKPRMTPERRHQILDALNHSAETLERLKASAEHARAAYAAPLHSRPGPKSRGFTMRKLFRRIAAIFGAPTVTHPDGKVFVRINDQWMPI